MSQPQGYEDPDHLDWVCEVSRSLYGLKQSLRQWNSELHTILISHGLSQSTHDPTLYYLHKNEKLVGLLTVHVDDIAVVGEPSFVTSTINCVSSKFKISSMRNYIIFSPLTSSVMYLGRRVT